MEDVDDLIITPFREIADKARQAVDNAGDGNPDMLKAAKSLMKEGERGLKRIEPLCKKHLEDYGSSFIAALKENDDIAKYRNDLTDLLWDFDDYIVPDEFDADKFAELQSLSRKAAPRIYDILMRMKLEHPVSDAASSRGSIAQLPTPTSHGFRSPGTSPPGDIQDVNWRLQSLMRTPSGPDPQQELPPAPPALPPPPAPPKPPSGNPWDWHSRPGEAKTSSDAASQHRRDVDDESPVLPSATLSDDGVRLAVVHPPPLSVAGSQYPEHSNAYEVSSPASIPSAPTHIPQSPRAAPRRPTFSSYTIPENEVSYQPSTIPFFQTSNVPYSPASQHTHRSSFPISETSESSEPRRPELTSQPNIDYRAPRASVAVPPLPSPVSRGFQHYESAPEPVPQQLSPAALADMDFAPIPVVEEEVPEVPKMTPERVEECKIDDSSSFGLTKGFCEGAKDVIKGGIGVKKTKKPVGFAASSTVARCLGCLYELDFGEVEADVNRQDKGNFVRNGIHFRVRFLQKSHIPAKRVDDVQFACVFCVHLGHTIDKSDATVFFNQKSLFEHLARHPRPLPEVPGITMIDERFVPDKLRNDYDVHFRQPPVPHPAVERASEITPLAVGIAKDQARRMYGKALLYDRSPALELAVGAKITGLVWPDPYMGVWCFGWHDGQYASVPADLVKLLPPPAKEIRYDRSSNIKATARWRFVQYAKDKDKTADWLKFDKGDTISNISWSHPDHWCWTGCTSRGKSGIFPASFLDPATLQEVGGTGASRLEQVADEKGRSLSVFSKLSMRKGSSGRAPSISSANSH